VDADHRPAILEHDPSVTAVIEPSEVIQGTDIRTHAVLCFFQDVIPRGGRRA
jgi:hypothetical protein